MPATAKFAPVKESPSAEWEVRPCGMVVQTPYAAASSAAAAAAVPPVPNIRVKVKHGAARLDIYISSQASFGELKKALSAQTGLHPLDMKLIYKDRPRPSTAFLDVAGVRDRSTVVLEEDPTARAKRLLEMRKANTMEKAAKSVSAIALEADRLASKVSALEAIAKNGGRVADNDVNSLTESLMNVLVKLDAIAGDGDAKSDRRLLMKRVQKFVETLDSIKLKNKNNSIEQLHKQEHRNKHSSQHPMLPKAPVVMTMNWETFDSLSTPSASTVTVTAAATSSAPPNPHASLNWELF
ncbi:BAG family molecular chaperone regulator 2-like [Zingiber officinale]|uniref:BAG family molecular chaperone regulator 2-like n=1 Tax=Zingiber officinale TaxID=94328 RepID=UPI001C4CFA8D|nr:BAG family molecular chaperone regulator 2-like [Zingiber officinale]